MDGRLCLHSVRRFDFIGSAVDVRVGALPCQQIAAWLIDDRDGGLEADDLRRAATVPIAVVPQSGQVLSRASTRPVVPRETRTSRRVAISRWSHNLLTPPWP